MNFFALFVRRQQTAARTSARSMPTLIDPKDYQHVAGGASLVSRPKAPAAASTQLPRGGW
jgi:hypothetical protein